MKRWFILFGGSTGFILGCWLSYAGDAQNGTIIAVCCGFLLGSLAATWRYV